MYNCEIDIRSLKDGTITWEFNLSMVDTTATDVLKATDELVAELKKRYPVNPSLVNEKPDKPHWSTGLGKGAKHAKS